MKVRIIRIDDGAALSAEEARAYSDEEIRVEKFCPVQNDWTTKHHGCGWSNNGEAFCAGLNGWDDALC